MGPTKKVDLDLLCRPEHPYSLSGVNVVCWHYSRSVQRPLAIS